MRNTHFVSHLARPRAAVNQTGLTARLYDIIIYRKQRKRFFFSFVCDTRNLSYWFIPTAPFVIIYISNECSARLLTIRIGIAIVVLS